MEALQQQKESELAALREEQAAKETNDQEDLASYKEQIKQHSVTICSMEERLNKAQKKSKTLQQENRCAVFRWYASCLVISYDLWFAFFCDCVVFSL